jgi:hypothetical protein
MLPARRRVDPHKGSHTAVAIDAADAPLGTVRVPASAFMAARLLQWAAAWPGRTWHIRMISPTFAATGNESCQRCTTKSHIRLQIARTSTEVKAIVSVEV